MKPTCRAIRISRIIFSIAFAAALAVVMAHAASAETAGGGIQHNVNNLIGACHFGGGSVSVNYEYEGDTLVSADVDCSGGDIDGYGCTFSAQSTVCTGAIVRPPQNPLQSVTAGKSQIVSAGSTSTPSPVVATNAAAKTSLVAKP
jgi:hypothetical protein